MSIQFKEGKKISTTTLTDLVGSFTLLGLAAAAMRWLQ